MPDCQCISLTLMLQMSADLECQALARSRGQEELGSKRELRLRSVSLPKQHHVRRRLPTSRRPIACKQGRCLEASICVACWFFIVFCPKLQLVQKEYEVLLVSQFTLYGLMKGNKPDFHLAMSPSQVSFQPPTYAICKLIFTLHSLQ